MTLLTLTRRVLALAVFCLSSFSAATAQIAPVAQPQTEVTAKKTNPLDGWKSELARIEASLKRLGLADRTLVAHRELLAKIVSGSEDFIKKTTPQLEDTQSQLKKLGPAPKNGAPPEAETVRQERQRLEKQVAEISGHIKSAEVLKVRAAQLSEVTQDRRRSLFSKQILKRVRSPLSSALWQTILPDARAGFTRLGLIISDWWRSRSSHRLLFAFSGLSLLVWFVLRRIARNWIIRYRSYAGDGEPAFFHRASSAGWVIIARAAPPITAAGLLYGGVLEYDLLSRPLDRLASSAFLAFTTIAAINALVLTLLAPNRPEWRLLPATDRGALRLSRLVVLIVVVYGADVVLAELNRMVYAPLSLTVLQSFVATLAIAGLLIAILRMPTLIDVSAPDEPGAHAFVTRVWNNVIRPPLWLLVIVILGAATLGYIALARFISSQLVITGSILVIAYLLHLSVQAFSGGFGNETRGPGRFLEQNFRLSQPRREQLGILTSFILNAVIILAALPLVLVQWGFNWQDVRQWALNALFGFQAGGLRISLVAILVSLLIFVFGMILTRFVQRWLDQRILSRTQSQTGAENSIRTGVGYLGFALSAVLAISYAGLDFSNLAIVAGALSVGIGFGLQSVVNNFVSGLILLVERPIRVGDWIVVGTDEGYVRRISVRSTEIETFDRSHIVIPNSQLISGTVKNWTLRSPLGRIVLRVGVAYDSDPDEVKTVLLNIASSHTDILDNPEPYVIFEDFGASSLDFSLRAYVANVDNSLRVRSDLRTLLLKEFRAAGIEIPYPQQDLHLRDIGELKTALQKPPSVNRRRKKS